MNFWLTNRCNRRCEYCFQKEWFLENQSRPLLEMNPDLFKTVVDRFRLRQVQILGGEPFLYTHLHEVLEFCQIRAVNVNILTNLSVIPSVAEVTIKRFGEIISSWLINCDYQNSEEDNVLTNIELLKKYSSGVYNISTTLLPKDGSEEERIDRLKKVLSVIGRDKRLVVRASTMSPAYNDVYRRYDYTKMFERLVSGIVDEFPLVKFAFDCMVQPCEIDFAVTEKLKDYIFRDIGCCKNPDFDVLPKGRVIFCSAARFITLPDIMKYSSEQNVRYDLRKQWTGFWKKFGLSEICRSCNNLKPGKCYGLCIAKTITQSGRMNEALKLSNVNK